MPERIKFEAIEPETSINLRYYGRPCVVTRIGKIGDKVRAVGVRLGINNQEFVHIALEKKTHSPAWCLATRPMWRREGTRLLR